MEPCFKTGKNTLPPFNTVPANDDLTSGYGRGLLTWYNIDPRFWEWEEKLRQELHHSLYPITLPEEYNIRRFIITEIS